MIAALGILLISSLWGTGSECHLINEGLKSVGENNLLRSHSPTDEKTFLGCRSTPLHFAVGLLRSLLMEGHDPHASDCDGVTPIDIAIKGNVYHLLKGILPIKDKNTHELNENCTSTPLHSAVRLILTLSRERSSSELRDCNGLVPFDFINNGALLGLGIEMVLIPPKTRSLTLNKVGEFCNRSSLHIAVIKNDVVSVLKLLENRVDMYALDCNGMTAMDLAVVKNHTEVMLFLAQAEFDVNRKHPDGSGLLSFAIHEGTVETVKVLLELGVNFQEIHSNMQLVFNKALTHNRLDIIQLLMRHGGNMNYMTENGDSFLHILSEEGNVRGIYLARKFGLITPKNINLQNNNGETALFKAVKGDYPAIVNILISCGANMTSKNKGGKTYLHIAVENKSIDALQALLENGLPADIKDDRDITSMYLAVKSDFTGPLAILKSFGADIQQKYKSENLLHKAVLENATKSIVWLLDNGLSVDEANINGFTPLHIAAKYGNMDAANALLARNASVSARTKHEDTPLHWAAWQGSLTMVQKLLSKGADVDKKQDEDWTPLHVAAYKNHLPVVKELLSRGANVNAKNNKNYTPLNLAVNDEVVKYLKSRGGVNKI